MLEILSHYSKTNRLRSKNIKPVYIYLLPLINFFYFKQYLYVSFLDCPKNRMKKLLFLNITTQNKWLFVLLLLLFVYRLLIVVIISLELFLSKIKNKLWYQKIRSNQHYNYYIINIFISKIVDIYMSQPKESLHNNNLNFLLSLN